MFLELVRYDEEGQSPAEYRRKSSLTLTFPWARPTLSFAQASRVRWLAQGEASRALIAGETVMRGMAVDVGLSIQERDEISEERQEFVAKLVREGVESVVRSFQAVGRIGEIDLDEFAADVDLVKLDYGIPNGYPVPALIRVRDVERSPEEIPDSVEAQLGTSLDWVSSMEGFDFEESLASLPEWFASGAGEWFESDPADGEQGRVLGEVGEGDPMVWEWDGVVEGSVGFAEDGAPVSRDGGGGV
jgi:hypothetical protein